MENDVNKENKKKNIIIVVLVFIIILLLVGGWYFLFIRKDELKDPVKSQDNQQVDNNSENIINENVYKTGDSKFTLKIIEKNNQKVAGEVREIIYEEQKELVKYNCKTSEEFDGIKCNNIDNDFERYFDDYYNTIINNIKAYAYLNDKLLYINKYIEDENYGSYEGVFVKNEDAEHSGSLWNRFVIDKKNKLIWEEKTFEFEDWMGEDSSINTEIYYRFRGMGLYYFKTDAGYYFAKEVEPGYLIYTKNRKQIGCAANYKNLKSDKNGIYVNSDFDESSTIIKYDIDGNKIS